ncbi:gigaxonin [Biomphalaria glabrata]|uniref:Gigaxonin-like n=1 Tax=Biomphalaria glabrata TaxID=6526 RepID=A0A2C9JJP8_BIOGL|nr:gigaxonin-like [Biomphalaria glabrata]KAI8755373.1 gigaxonin-like [Biomphalaria glabrata]KAI8792892.1 gigaxonin [Biomphalaria glabrata]
MANLTNNEEPNKKSFYHKHASKLLKSLNESRDRPNLCDAVVIIGSSQIPVQKNILSAASHYFRALFDYDDHITNNAKEKQGVSSGSTVSLDHMGIDENTFKSILDFIYTAEVKLNPHNIQDMLQAADQLLMSDLKDICCEFLDTCINAQNSIGILDFTSQLSCSWLHLKVTQYLDAHFNEVSQYDEFLRLDEERVAKLLSRTTIDVKKEDDVLDIILRWYRFEPENRGSQAIDLMRKVLYAHQLSDGALSKCTELKDQLGHEFLHTIMKLREEQRGNPVIHRGFTRVIVACGGEGTCVDRDDCEIKNYVRCVRPIKTKHPATWIELAPMLNPRCGHGLVEVGGYLYAAGGRDSNCRILNSCEKYDPFTNTWTYVAPMNHARVGFGLVAIENMIYAIGGSNDMTDPLMSVEAYDVFTDKWKPLPDMIMKRAWACYVAAGSKIYVLGGGIIGKFYESVEVFDTRSLTWNAVSPMRERRCDARAVAVGNDIYVFGGFRRIECPSAAHSGHNLKLCGTEFYSEKNDYWMPIQNRSGAVTICAVGESTNISGVLYDEEDILIVGELDMGGDEVHTVRSFNRHTNTWDCLVVTRPKLQTRYQCCLLSLPKNLLYKLLWEQGKLNYSDILMC